jgi:hypothetical protein
MTRRVGRSAQATPDPQERLYSREQVAQMLQFNPDYVGQLTREGKIGCYKLGVHTTLR